MKFSSTIDICPTLCQFGQIAYSSEKLQASVYVKNVSVYCMEYGFSNWQLLYERIQTT